MNSTLSRDAKHNGNQQKITNITLFILLAVRILYANPFLSVAQLFSIDISQSDMKVLDSIQQLADYFWFSWSFVFVGVITVINRNNLQEMNIDRAFVATFIIGSMSYWMYENRYLYGYTGLLLSIVIYVLYLKKQFKFIELKPIAKQIAVIVAIVFLLGLVLKRNSLSVGNVLWLIQAAATDFPFVICEEILFRGLLWKFLVNTKLSAPWILGLQALLFWFSHIDTMIAYPIFFWIITPIASLVFGIIVWRSKSITVSFIAHILTNFLIRLY